MHIKEQARKYFEEGKYNCCQAVICAYCHECGMDDDAMFRMTEGFGLGMGGLKDTCGAVTGLFMAISLHNSAGDKKDPRKTKIQTYKDIRNAAADFEEKYNSIYCRGLKAAVENKQKISCADCVEYAADYLEKYIAEYKQEHSNT